MGELNSYPSRVGGKTILQARVNKIKLRYYICNECPGLMGMELWMVNETDWRSKALWLVSCDGLWDMGLGLTLLGFVLTIGLENAIWFIGSILLAYFMVVMAGKEYFTRSRMVYFVVDELRLKYFSTLVKIGLALILLLLITGTLTFMIFEFGPSFHQMSDYSPSIVGGIITILFLLLGFLTIDGSRYYYYAGFVLLSFTICQILYLPVLPVILAIGGLLLLSGSYLLVRFVTKFPKLDTSMS